MKSKTYVVTGTAKAPPTFKEFAIRHWAGYVAATLMTVAAVAAAVAGQGYDLVFTRSLCVLLLLGMLWGMWETTRLNWVFENSNTILFNAYIQQCDTTTQMARELMKAQEEIQRLKQEASKP